MSEKKTGTIEVEDTTTEAAEMDLNEAAAVAKILAKLAVEAENRAALLTESDNSIQQKPSQDHHILTEEELLAAEAKEQADKVSFKGRLSSAGRRIFKVLTPDNSKLAIPAIIAELLVLVALVAVLVHYSHTAPGTPPQYADPAASDIVTCSDGVLTVNGISALVPDDDNVNYSISYVWAASDVDYPSVPHAIVASYYNNDTYENNDDTGSVDIQESSSSEAGNTDGEDAQILYEITLYKDSFTPQNEIPEGKNAINWFSDWETSTDEEVYKFPHKVGDVRGFCISTMDADAASAGYGTYTYYFAVPENDGIAIYVLEGICYDKAQRETFKEIIKNSINSITTSQSQL